MTVRTREYLQNAAATVSGEVNPNGNTRERVGGLLRDLADSMATVDCPGMWVLRGRYPAVGTDSDPLVVSGDVGTQLAVPLFASLSLPELAAAGAAVRLRFWAIKPADGDIALRVGLSDSPSDYQSIQVSDTGASALFEVSVTRSAISGRLALDLGVESDVGHRWRLSAGSMIRIGTMRPGCPYVYLVSWGSNAVFQIRWAEIETRVGMVS